MNLKSSCHHEGHVVGANSPATCDFSLLLWRLVLSIMKHIFQMTAVEDNWQWKGRKEAIMAIVAFMGETQLQSTGS